MQTRPLPLMYVSDKRTIYLGRSSLPLREVHSGCSWFMICLEGQLRFRANDNEQWVISKSLLVPAGSKILIDNRNAVLAAFYLDACKPDFMVMKSLMRAKQSGIYCDYLHESAMIETLLELREEEPDFETAQQRVEELIYNPHIDTTLSLTVDPRIQHVVQRIRETAADNLSVKELAKEVDMSESGLIKLFRKNIGAPIRKHRLWYRVTNFITFVLAGKSIPEATKLAGFSDASHLSKCYSSLMGVPISVAFNRSGVIKCIAADTAISAAEAVAPVSHRLPSNYADYIAQQAS